MSNLPPPTVLVLGGTDFLARAATHHVEANSPAGVVNCGTNVNRAALTLGSEPVDAVLVLSNGDDEFLDDGLGTLIDRASTLSCPVLVNGVSEEQKRRLEETEADALRVMTREEPLERLWEELERAAGVEREDSAG